MGRGFAGIQTLLKTPTQLAAFRFKQARSPFFSTRFVNLGARPRVATIYGGEAPLFARAALFSATLFARGGFAPGFTGLAFRGALPIAGAARLHTLALTFHLIRFKTHIAYARLLEDPVTAIQSISLRHLVRRSARMICTAFDQSCHNLRICPRRRRHRRLGRSIGTGAILHGRGGRNIRYVFGAGIPGVTIAPPVAVCTRQR